MTEPIEPATTNVPANVPPVVNFTIAAKPERQAAPSNKVAVAKLVLEYSKVLVWPLFIALILLVYQPPIGAILTSLANKFENASSVKIGSLSLEVQAQAADLGVPGLGLQIGQLSADSIEALLQSRGNGSMILLSQNGGTSFGLPKSTELNALLDLEKKGLIQPWDNGESIAKFVAYVKSVARFTRPGPHDETQFDNFEINDPDGEIAKKFQHYGYELTPSGHKAVEAITKAVAAQLSKPSESEGGTPMEKEKSIDKPKTSKTQRGASPLKD
jgi:hypothetical protein